MRVMATPWKHSESGYFYFRRQVPADILTVVGRCEWKVSLKTKDLSVAGFRLAAGSPYYQQFCSSLNATASL
ncbi:DUF6538 domain-containing protein [Oceanimonas doudoroffii]|uniref:DUF6538 domain-containing protein n=1 Tax=Oceanimonas doudoroffii TaxID=84158 RepID=UPI003CCC3633